MTDGAATEEFIEIVGKENWIDDRATLLTTERATFPTQQRIRGIALPGSVDEVCRVIRVCNRHQLSVYPIGRGCNWGLGSKVPLKTGSILVDLSRMSSIEEYDEEFGWIRIGPGTTFRQVSEFLKANGGRHFLSVTGGAPESSVLANTLERGDGLGPMGDRSKCVASLQVVLGDGRVLNTGFSAFGYERVGHLTQDSLGPALDGLFFQSNFGIVTGMTVWLSRATEHYASILFTVRDGSASDAVLGSLKELVEHGVIRGNSFAWWNMQKVIAAAGDHPLRDGRSIETALTDEQMQQYLPSFFRGAYWLGTIAVYGLSRRHLQAQLQEITLRLRPVALRSMVMTPRRARAMSFLRYFMPTKRRKELERWIDAFFTRSVYRGNPSELSIRSLYWRKPGGVSHQVDPNGDRCGLVWLCHSIPFAPMDIVRAEKLVKSLSLQANIDPNVAFLCINERYVRMFVALMYDRDNESMDAQALHVQQQLHNELVAQGYPAFRLGIQSMEFVSPSDGVYREVVSTLKGVFDPNGVISPGRYDFSQTSKLAYENGPL